MFARLCVLICLFAYFWRIAMFGGNIDPNIVESGPLHGSGLSCAVSLMKTQTTTPQLDDEWFVEDCGARRRADIA